jgi:predicted  nucleic acid-binding Zn-ribbon protein
VQHRHEAAPPAKARAPIKTESEGDAQPKMKSHAKPRPSRDKLDEAEQALEHAKADHEVRIADFRRRERELQKQHRGLKEGHKQDVNRLEAALANVRDRYSEALQKWRSD